MYMATYPGDRERGGVEGADKLSLHWTKHGEGHARASNKACPPPEKHETCELLICKIQSTDMLKPWNSIDSFPRGPGPFKKLGLTIRRKQTHWFGPPSRQLLRDFEDDKAGTAEWPKLILGFTMFHFCLFILFYVLSQFGRKFQNTEPWFEMSISLHQPTFGFGLTPTASTLASWPISQINVEKDPGKKECLRRISHTKFQRCMLKRHLSQICLASLCWSSAKSLGVFPARCLPQNYHQQSSTSWSPTNALNIRNSLKRVWHPYPFG